MGRANNTKADVRYRAVVTVKKTGPDMDDSYRDQQRNRGHIAANLDYWEEYWAKDDATVGEITEWVSPHYDTIPPAKQAVNKYVKRQGVNYEVESIQFQKVLLEWQDCDEHGE